MKLFPWLIFGSAAYFLFKSGSTARAASQFEYGISSFRIDTKKTSIQNGLVGTLGFSIYNPTEKDVIYQRFVGNLIHQGVRVGNIDPSGANVSIKGRQNTVIPLLVTIPLSFFGSSLLDVATKLISGKKLAISKILKIQGSIKISGLPDMPVDYDFNLGDYL